MAVAIVAARLPTGEVPVCGVTLDPYVQLRLLDSNTTATAEDIPEENSDIVHGSRYVLRSVWSRSVIQGRAPSYCCIHPELEAAIQCTLCQKLKAAIPVHKSFHCSTKCFTQHWCVHREMHEKGEQQVKAGLTEQEQSCVFRGSTFSNGGETWLEVGHSRLYCPSAEDVGLVLRYECYIVDTQTGHADLSSSGNLQTARVRPAPNPPRRQVVSIVPAGGSVNKFSLLTYNMLADVYATSEVHSSCPPWALSWSYRRQNLLRELLSYQADIMCLQEVQSDHYNDFLMPELQRAGYTAIFKKKTTELFNKNSYVIDGCATFFKRNKFSLVKKYEVEFNKAALSLSETLHVQNQKKAALARLLKDNVALIAVLEAIENPGQALGSRRLICVANTHIHANPELSDVKLWQVHTLLKGLEKIAASADIPMLVAGDFNSIPGSAAHQLLVNRRIDPAHKDLLNDPLGINKPGTKLSHQLCLASAYAAYATAHDSADVKRQKKRLDPVTYEPMFSNIAKDFMGTLDYILYTTDSLVPVGLLELPNLDDLIDRGAPEGRLPCSEYSSDHIALLSEFEYRRQGP